VNLVVIGALYWLLWTLMVYEGGLSSKVAALARAASGGTNGPDAFDGWLGNAAAFLLCGGVVAGLHRTYRAAEKRAAKR